MTNPFPETLDVDDDGYPSDERIAQLRMADDMPNAIRWLVETFPKLVESIPCGYVRVSEGVDDFDGAPITIISFSTGGWSGQEDLIGALEYGLIGRFYLWSWRRGGHYEFRLPIEPGVDANKAFDAVNQEDGDILRALSTR